VEVICCKKEMVSVTARPVPAGVACIFSLLFGLAAAGFTEFQGGRAGFPVADPAVGLLVFFTAGAGVFINAPASGGDWFLGAGCWFWHCITLALLCYNYSYAHKSFKLSYPSGTLPGGETRGDRYLCRPPLGSKGDLPVCCGDARIRENYKKEKKFGWGTIVLTLRG